MRTVVTLSLLPISLFIGTSVASPVSFLYSTFGFEEALTPSPGSTVLDASNHGLGFLSN